LIQKKQGLFSRPLSYLAESGGPKAYFPAQIRRSEHLVSVLDLEILCLTPEASDLAHLPDPHKI